MAQRHVFLDTRYKGTDKPNTGFPRLESQVPPIGPPLPTASPESGTDLKFDRHIQVGMTTGLIDQIFKF